MLLVVGIFDTTFLEEHFLEVFISSDPLFPVVEIDPEEIEVYKILY